VSALIFVSVAILMLLALAGIAGRQMNAMRDAWQLERQILLGAIDMLLHKDDGERARQDGNN